MDASATAAIEEIAKDFIRCLHRVAPDFERAFFRFKLEPEAYGSNASYISGAAILLVDPFENSAFFENANERVRSLLHTFGKTRAVALLTVDASFDYKIDFDWNDLDRWRITKVDGASGIPAGL
ncbi:MAG TPA: hypothetical protein VK980_11905 [Sphingomonas sp.]|nr:hypothetical protein [Sphingomonas sp.]